MANGTSVNLQDQAKELPVGWEVALLGDVAACRGGYGFPPKEQGRAAGEIPFFKVSDMNLEGNSRVMESANNYVDSTALPRLKARPFEPGTVIFPKIGAAIATNKKRLLVRPSLIDNNVMGIWPTDADRLISEFLYYWLLSVDLRSLSASGPLPSIAQHSVLNSNIPLPPLSEQRAIAYVLQAIEQTKEATQKVVTSARELKRSVMQRLYTYGPVSVDAAEHVELQETQIGLIPAHWSVVELGELAIQTQYGLSLILQSQFYALLLVVGASSGGLVASSPDRPAQRERRIDCWAPDQAGQ